MSSWEIITGDALAVLDKYPDGYFDGIVTDPPYSSSSIGNKGLKKYSGAKGIEAVIMPNDDMEQRLWIRFTIEWLRKACCVLKKGAPFIIFTDWRQLPALCDTISCSGAGLVIRGFIPWDKRNSRPLEGGFRNQCEYCVWGSLGSFKGNSNLYLPGCYSVGIVPASKRRHIMEKPLGLMRELVKIVKKGGRILDPFCGSGATILAAALEGYEGVGIEVVPNVADTARRRLSRAFENNLDLQPTCNQLASDLQPENGLPL